MLSGEKDLKGKREETKIYGYEGGGNMNPYTEIEGYTYKEITKATEIMEYCNGTHTEKEIQIFMDKVIEGLTDREKENIIEILETVCKKL